MQVQVDSCKKKTDMKNESHAILSSEMLHPGDVLTDISGKKWWSNSSRNLFW
jgi:transposase